MDQKNPQPLFTGFPPIPTNVWEEKINADLKGADYKRLIWKSGEGFDVRPYYRAEDLVNLSHLNSIPGESPFVRGNRTLNNDWLVRQDILVSNVEEANRIAREAIERGAGAIGLDATEVTTHRQMGQLLQGIDISRTSINFLKSRSYPLTVELFLYEINHRGVKDQDVKGSINFDPIGYLLRHGDFYKSWEHNLEEAEYLLSAVIKRLPGFRVVTVNGHFFADGGATLVQEVAFSLAMANEYLAGLTDKGHTIDQLVPRLMFSQCTGSNYFMEIAKLRAMRLLWARLVSAYHPAQAASSSIFIHTATASWNKTVFDPYVNMLRTTTEGMSAALGNADSVTIHPFDVSFRDPSGFSSRIALNQQLVLKEESYLNKVVDPGAGSYYIENLTDSIAHHAWELFLTVEQGGGIIESIKRGFIQDQVEGTRRQKEMDIAQRKLILLGTNQYPNAQERPMEEIHTRSAVTEVPSTYKKLKPFRVAEGFEKIRMATEQYVKLGHKRPSVFLFTMGNLAMLRARAGFAANFFGCAGYEVIDNPGFATVEDGVKSALESGCEIVVVCSSDEEYAQIVPAIAPALKSDRKDLQIIVAGFPKEILEMLKSAGVDDFIHVRSNLLERLEYYQQVLHVINSTQSSNL